MQRDTEYREEPSEVSHQFKRFIVWLKHFSKYVGMPPVADIVTVSESDEEEKRGAKTEKLEGDKKSGGSLFWIIVIAIAFFVLYKRGDIADFSFWEVFKMFLVLLFPVQYLSYAFTRHYIFGENSKECVDYLKSNVKTLPSLLSASASASVPMGM